MSDSEQKDKRRSVVQSLPSDYSDVQPKNYDPEFISEISNRMQVPDSIHAYNGHDSTHTSRFSGGWGDGMRGPNMDVPERIMLAGGGKHIGSRPEIRNLDFDNIQRGGDHEMVALLTPPRTLTLDEQFPREAEEEEEIHMTPRRIPNGNVSIPEPYTPGISTSESLLLNEEDEATQMKTQVAKLMRRVALIEKDQKTQASREMMLYTAGFGYFMIKFLFWFFRSK